MSDPLFVRPVDASDWSPWHGLWLGYDGFYGRAGATALPEAVTRSTWSRSLDAEEPLDANVAEQDEVSVRLAHCVWHQGRTSEASSSESNGTARRLSDLVADHAGFIAYSHMLGQD